jgi:hypothetical protein
MGDSFAFVNLFLWLIRISEAVEYGNSKTFHVKENRPWGDGHGGQWAQNIGNNR